MPRPGPRWTPAEDAVLVEHYPKRGGPARCAALLPGRSPAAIQLRARRVCPPRRRHMPWTEREVLSLRLAWGETPRTLREKLPGRTWVAIVHQARAIGLGSVARYQGVVSLTEAARVCGYAWQTLLSILRREGVRVEHYHGGRGAERRVQGRARHMLYAVDLDEAREAVERHLATGERPGVLRAVDTSARVRRGVGVA